MEPRQLLAATLDAYEPTATSLGDAPVASQHAQVVDLGVLPSLAPGSIADVKSIVLIPGGTSVDYHFENDGAPLTGILLCWIDGGPGQVGTFPESATVAPGRVGPYTRFDMTIPSGEGFISATSLGDETVSFDWELILANGLGQGPAATLTLVDPSSAGPSVPISAAVIPLPPTPTPNPGTSAVSPATAPLATAAESTIVVVGGLGQGSTTASDRPSFVLSVDDAPVGRPRANAEQVAAVGPAVNAGSPALASRLDGISPGIALGPTLPDPSSVRAAEPSLDRRVLDRTAWLDHVCTLVRDWVLPSALAVATAPAREGPPDVISADGNRPPDSISGGVAVEQASTAPMVVFTATVVGAARSLHWWRRRQTRPIGATARLANRPSGSGPVPARPRHVLDASRDRRLARR